MKRVREYYIGKPCKMDIGADGQIAWAVGRIVGEAEGAVKSLDIYGNPSVIYFTTPHGSTFTSTFNELYELDRDDVQVLKRYEIEATSAIGVHWYGARLNDVSHDIMKIE